MNNKHSSKFSLFVSAILLSFSTTSYALNSEENETNTNNVIIPMMTNAQVFADFTDELPAVLNYFTHATEKQIIDFYQQHYSDAISQERKRGRLTLTYQQEKHNIRIVISPQNKKRQVDVIIELKEENAQKTRTIDVKYTCTRDTKLSVTFTASNSDSDKKIAIINGFGEQAIIIPNVAVASGFLYSNGKYSLRGKGKKASWTVGRMASFHCSVGDKPILQKDIK
jgi:membrane-bound inhibitor of C-type lysozyme